MGLKCWEFRAFTSFIWLETHEPKLQQTCKTLYKRGWTAQSRSNPIECRFRNWFRFNWIWIISRPMLTKKVQLKSKTLTHSAVGVDCGDHDGAVATAWGDYVRHNHHFLGIGDGGILVLFHHCLCILVALWAGTNILNRWTVPLTLLLMEEGGLHFLFTESYLLKKTSA